VAEQQELEVDLEARPVAAPVEEAELDGELVLYNPVDHRIHHLDRTGSLVWQLLDGSATIAELIDDIAGVFGTPPAVVEQDVRALVTELHTEGLLLNSSSGRFEPYPADHLSDPPNPCESDVRRLELGEAFTIRVDGRDVALQVSPDLTSGLQEILREHLVDVDPAGAPAHFSAFVPGDDREVNRLYHGFCPRTRSVDPARVLRSLVDHAATALPALPGTVSVFARAAIIDGERAVLLPHVLDDSLKGWDARLRQAGIVLTDAPVLGLDLDTAEVVLADRLGFGPQLDELVASLPARRREPPPAPGRYPLERWWFVHYFGDPGPASRAQAARRAAQILDPGHDLDGAFFTRLGELFDRVDAQVGDMRETDPIRLLLGNRR
jgi:hypothetical protein